MVQGIAARCGTFVVPENRAKPAGRTIGLHVVVLPAFSKPIRKDAVTYLAGGPGDAATEEASVRSQQLSAAERSPRHPARRPARHRRSKPHNAEVTQYGTRMAMDDLDAVRAALGYRQLDVIGSSYGATAAQVYLKLHPGLGAHAHPRRAALRSTSPSSTGTRSTPSAPSTNSRDSAPRSPTAGRRSRTGSASSASS